MEHLLEIRNLSIVLSKGKRKPPILLVEGVNLDITKKKNFGIVGESGCGKSITASTIMGLLSYPLTVGKGSSIRLQRSGGAEDELTSLTKAEMRALRGKDIAMIFQEPMTALDPMYTIEYQISETLHFHTSLSRKEMHDTALQMLERVKIPRAADILKEYPHHLSGGMLQRVMIAIALINNPRLLIADEPTTALDVTIQAQILDLMNELRESYDTSVIMITHDLGVVAETCEQVAVFYAGQVVEEATVEDIFHRTAHPYTEGLLKSVTSLDGGQKGLYTIRGMVPTAGNFSAGCRFADRCDRCMERCRREAPALVEVAPGHKCRCWLHVGRGEDTQ